MSFQSFTDMNIKMNVSGVMEFLCPSKISFICMKAVNIQERWRTLKKITNPRQGKWQTFSH